MFLIVTLFIISMIGYVIAIRFKSNWVRTTLLCLTASSLIFINILLLTGYTKNVIGDKSKSKQDEVIKRAKEKLKDNLISTVKIKEKVLINAPNLIQYPELPRGCEVTSLAMLLQFKGIRVEKMELAEKIKKDVTPLENQKGILFWGDPNEGFIGSMYSLDEPGYGVYHKPIRELAEQYLPGKIVDLTGKNFVELQVYLSLNTPIWVITNTTYRKLPESAFETLETPQGKVKITYKEHAVLITGYDNQTIFFNDPRTGTQNMAVGKQDFLEAWLQMGGQAISYLPDSLDGKQIK